MDLNESESGKGGEMEIHHFSHQHPLMFCLASGTAYCFGCDQSVQGPRYGCNEWNDYSICHGCSNLYYGFSYRCNEDCMSHYNWDIRCYNFKDINTVVNVSTPHTLEQPCLEVCICSGVIEG
ncbi:hypothetical protein V6N11_033118 [Hibiscus sabdariffa]|uniref:Uncharacterized protein n=2 Tax=Hibiscus sabdariffa TaxID=183260 RepID=A0ABR2CBW0_9ROSI